MYINDDFELLDEFRQKGSSYFGAEPKRMPFGDDETRVSINEWVAAHTENKIRDLFKPGSISQDMLMILVNAVYFKGRWATAFDAAFTEDREFAGAASRAEVKFMTLEGKFRTGRLPSRVGDGSVVRLPYVGGKVAMYVVLPDENATLAELEGNFDQLDLNGLDGVLGKRAQTVLLGLPRFKLESTHEMTSVMRKMGADEMFLPSKQCWSFLFLSL